MAVFALRKLMGLRKVMEEELAGLNTRIVMDRDVLVSHATVLTALEAKLAGLGDRSVRILLEEHIQQVRTMMRNAHQSTTDTVSRLIKVTDGVLSQHARLHELQQTKRPGADERLTDATSSSTRSATTSPSASLSAELACAAIACATLACSDGESPMTALPQELLVRVLELLPATARVNAERVNHDWQRAIGALENHWPEWRQSRATLTEQTLQIPGVAHYPFGAPPTEVPADMREAAARAATQAENLASEHMELALCGSMWSVLAMSHRERTGSSVSGVDGSGGDHVHGGSTGWNPSLPKALRQHQTRDFMLTACVASGLVYSGDKESSLRVWDARSGALIARVPSPASTCSALAASRGQLLMGDSQGQIYRMAEAALRRGQVDAVHWRAHDGKVSCLHAEMFGDGLLSGGADGGVRQWAGAKVLALAHARPSDWPSDPPEPSGGGIAARTDGRGVASGTRSDLGLWALAESVALARHSDTVVHVTRDQTFCYSASREGVVLVTALLTGTPKLQIRDCGSINSLAAHRGKLLLCSDDGQQATLQLWDVHAKTRVQEVGGIRKWNAPTSIGYLGYDKCFWVRDTTLCTMHWTDRRPQGSAAAAGANTAVPLP